jgi:hypothetical protein
MTETRFISNLANFRFAPYHVPLGGWLSSRIRHRSLQAPFETSALFT